MSADAAFAVIERAIDRGPIPGAAAAVDDRSACFGHLEPGGLSVTDDTWYDLASLTKVLVTVPLLLEQVVLGRLDPMASVRSVLPETSWLQTAPNLGDARVLDLVTHTSGLKAWEPLYTLGLDRPTLLARALHAPIEGSPGSITYSDLGYIILGHLLERLVGAPLQEQATHLFQRLGLDAALTFGPVQNGPVAPTEDCPWRGRVLRGEVHDENAAALGGVSGHAGLFGSLRGVTGFARALRDGRLFPSPVVEYLAREHARGPGTNDERRGFGWMLAYPGWSGGEIVSHRTLGHTGFTGTGLWIDLERGHVSVLLTNRVHPSRHVESGIVPLRRAFNLAAHASP